jgi:hypothetical protein
LKEHVLPYEIDFLRAGESNGDAIVVKWGDTKDGDFYLNVIDDGSLIPAIRSSNTSSAIKP